MGKFGPRLSSRKKAKRWAKGQSSSSNPETRKYRDQAKTSFFQPSLGPSVLTTEGLKKHNAIQGLEIENKIELDEVESIVSGTTFKTFDTFASDWSNCSNISFNRFLNHFQSNSAMHKEMLAVLAAITEVIKQNKGTESSTEYYAALMTALEAAETEESVAAILSLLGMGMKSVPENVLRLQFGQASQIFLQILTKYASEENFLILRHCIGCLSILLRIQESIAWSNASTMQILDAILAFTTYSKPKIRKAAQHAVCSILKGSSIMRTDNPPAFHPAAPQVAKHCLAQLEIAGQPGQLTSTLHTLTLLKDIAHQLPKTFVKSLCEALLSIMTLNNVLVTSCCFQTLHGLFISQPTEAILPSQLNAQIINALYDYQPAPGDAQPTLAWLAVMQEAYCNLAMHSLELCALNLPRIIEKCTELWLSQKIDILSGASHTLKALLETCVTPLCENKTLKQKCKPILIKIIHLIQQGMKYQYNSAWHHVLHILASVFKAIGPVCQKELEEILKELADLRDSYKFSYNAEIEFAVGAAVKSLGPEVILSAIPLKTSTGEFDLKRSWVLPVLKDCIDQSSLSYFIDNLLPLAESCELKSQTLKEKGDGIGAHSNELLTSQIWALLPSFCNNPPDIKENFQRIARTLGLVISEKKHLRLSVMASLRKLLQKSIDANNQNDIEELGRFAKNYLPLLFHLYTFKPQGTDEEGQRLACCETIKVYLKVTSQELIGTLFDNALENLAKSDKTDFFKESVFDLLRILCQYADINRVQVLYEKCVPLLADTKLQKEQKKAYRFLEEICASTNDACQEFVRENRKAIQKLIIKSVSTVQKPSKSARIRCIMHLVEKHPQIEKTKFLKAIVPEAVMGVKELNEKCRTSSYTLLNKIAEKFLNNEEYFQDYINMLVAGLSGDPVYCSASLLSLTSITYHYNGSLGNQTIQNILEFTCTLVTGPTREITLSALSFIKVFISVMPTPTIGLKLNLIVKALTCMTDDCKRHFRQKVRDILVKLVRKFGIENITPMIPSSDQVMHKRLKNIRKVETRKHKLKDQKKDKNIDEDEEFNVKRKPKSLEEILADSEEEFDNSDNEEQSKIQNHRSKKKTWIQESENDIVDFIDPRVAKNISTTKPKNDSIASFKPKTKDKGFKTAPDGRLIIADDSGNESEDEKTKKKKNKLSFMEVDSENEDDKNGAEFSKPIKLSGLRKRKLSDSDASLKSDNPSLSSKYKAGGSGIHRPLKSHKKIKELGEEYKSKKAFGDVKKKGKPDPYVYIPLTRSSLNRRNKKGQGKEFKKLLHRKKDKNVQKNSRKK